MFGIYLPTGTVAIVSLRDCRFKGGMLLNNGAAVIL